MNKSSRIDPYLNIIKYFLTLIGQWPYQLPKEKIIYRIVGQGICTLILVPGLIALYDVRHDSATFFDCIPPLFTVFLSFSYAICYSLNITKIKSLTETMKRDWLSLEDCETELEIIERSAQRGKYLIRLFAIYSYTSTAIYVMSPMLPQVLDLILPLNESRARIFVFRVNYVFIENDDYYYLIYLHSILAAFITLTNIVAVDFIFLTTAQHACGMFQLLGYRLANVVDKNYKVNKCDIIEDNKINQRMVRCIQLYNGILEFTENIELSFSNMFLLIFGINMLIISFQGVQIVLNLNNTPILIRFGTFFLGQIIHLFYNTIPGQMLIDESSKVSQYCYECNWTEMSIKSQKLLLFILLRASRECKVSAGKIYTISMENYSSVLKTSFSYLSVLSSVQ
ncbi:odorant receptor 9a-like [Leptopilina boulardi]|uniref:odorant receptor 9a-like n=1 Tax=Leptopilina boulardi TaxID=63433 RepID=UPI0021F65598|nr:odorant receptor 9a-like [Leptopilina boulardi]XP_051172780.1 odorant receptor 9a-like [Leptopilina boulardi]